jgi:hypothetical protein
MKSGLYEMPSGCNVDYPDTEIKALSVLNCRINFTAL